MLTILYTLKIHTSYHNIVQVTYIQLGT